ncbi:MAG: cupredoxin domain-containing protein [Dermatophilaceae bacterium]
MSSRLTTQLTTKPLMTIAAAGLLVVLTGCGSSATTADSASGPGATTSTSSPSSTPGNPAATSSTSAPQAAEPVLITIKDFMYTLPASVAPGAKIMVKNQDAQNHTVTSTPKGTFAVTVGGGGGTASFTAPAKPGSYQFACDFHANMMGTLVVR